MKGVLSFRQREAYTNRVRLYRQIGTIYELSSDMKELSEIMGEQWHWLELT